MEKKQQRTGTGEEGGKQLGSERGSAWLAQQVLTQPCHDPCFLHPPCSHSLLPPPPTWSLGRSGSMAGSERRAKKVRMALPTTDRSREGSEARGSPVSCKWRRFQVRGGGDGQRGRAGTGHKGRAAHDRQHTAGQRTATAGSTAAQSTATSSTQDPVTKPGRLPTAHQGAAIPQAKLLRSTKNLQYQTFAPAPYLPLLHALHHLPQPAALAERASDLSAHHRPHVPLQGIAAGGGDRRCEGEGG